MKLSNTSKPVAIDLQNVKKKYVVHHHKPTFTEHFFNNQKNEAFFAINGVSLTINQGEKIGIIGPNGSGKTTLLKLIAGITRQTSGTITTNGKIVSLIDLEAGFHPDLSGYENIYLNGLLVGMTKSEINSNLNKIVKFADIGKFIDSPLYTYSQGMKLRLGFSIAVHADPDILIIDEGVTVGDENFHRKAKARIDSFFKAGKTILVVTHWLDFLRENCDKIVWIEKAKVKKMGGKSLLTTYAHYVKKNSK